MTRVPKFVKRLPVAAENLMHQSSDSGLDAPTLFQQQDVLGDVLKWEVRPRDGRPSFDCDLTEFAEGDVERTIVARPQLIRELMPSIYANSVGKTKMSVRGMLARIRQFWRFLDHVTNMGMGMVLGCEHVSHAHGQLYKTWLLQDQRLRSRSAGSALWMAHRLVSDARRRKGMEAWRLLWPTIQLDRGTLHKDVDPVILKPLYRELKAHHAASRRAFREGADLAQRGIDPSLRWFGNRCSRLVARGKHRCPRTRLLERDSHRPALGGRRVADALSDAKALWPTGFRPGVYSGKQADAL
jgi:hypothetical protein